jgi:hypothetical protein
MGTRHTQGKPAVALVQEGLECVVAVLGRRHPLDQLVLFFLREIDQLVLGVVGQLEEELEVQVAALEGEVRGGSTRPDPTRRVDERGLWTLVSSIGNCPFSGCWFGLLHTQNPSQLEPFLVMSEPTMLKVLSARGHQEIGEIIADRFFDLEPAQLCTADFPQKKKPLDQSGKEITSNVRKHQYAPSAETI